MDREGKQMNKVDSSFENISWSANIVCFGKEPKWPKSSRRFFCFPKFDVDFTNPKLVGYMLIVGEEEREREGENMKFEN